MFDLGYTTGLSARDILKTTDIFVSHTHVDHFIGFDSILRVCLKKEGPLRFYGPEGFTDCVEGKLRSYTWNLTGEYPLVIEVSEVKEKSINRATFRAKNSFIREDLAIEPFNGILVKDTSFHVSAAVLDHQIPCLAFSLEEDYHINIDKSKLNKLNLPVGEWLGELKSAIRKNKSDSFFTVKEKTYAFSEVKNIASISKGQKISYVVDAVNSEKNRKKIVELVKNSDVLYIETFFLDEDRKKARERYHLTAKEAGSIARKAGVGRLVPIHFSPRYINKSEKLIREAEVEFTK